MDEASAVLRVIFSTSVLMMDMNIIHNMPSRQHLDKCLMESLETGPAELTQETDITVPVKLFALKNPDICTVMIVF